MSDISPKIIHMLMIVFVHMSINIGFLAFEDVECVAERTLRIYQNRSWYSPE